MAVFGDYTMNVVVSHAPNTFTPMTTAFLTIVVGTPVTYYLMNQHFDLRLAMAKKAALEVELTAAVEARKYMQEILSSRLVCPGSGMAYIR